MQSLKDGSDRPNLARGWVCEWMTHHSGHKHDSGGCGAVCTADTCCRSGPRRPVWVRGRAFQISIEVNGFQEEGAKGVPF